MSCSETARATGITAEPVAIVWTDKKPEGALELKKDTWGCVMWLFAKVARDGRTAVFSRDTIGCAGGAMGLGFGRPFAQHAARTEEGFCSFLSNGIEGAGNREVYEAIVDRAMDAPHRKMLLEGERFMKNPSVVKKFLANLPVYDVNEKYIVMKPVSSVEEGENIRSVTFLANADQIAALSLLVNYETAGIRGGIIVAAGAAGCQAMGVCTYAEGETDIPRAVVGLTDLSARKNVRNLLGKDKLTFSVPYDLYLQMERNVPGSFLELDLWKEIRDSP
jgi:hypothetical protein